jgi:hypothetical protein
MAESTLAELERKRPADTLFIYVYAPGSGSHSPAPRPSKRRDPSAGSLACVPTVLMTGNQPAPICRL